MTRRPALTLLLAGLCCAVLACGGTTDRASRRITYAALGDSTAFGIGSTSLSGYPPRLARRIRDAGREVELVNLSVPGARASDLASLQAPAAARLRPGLLTVGIGANDVGRSSREEFAADLERIAADVGRLGAPVVIANIPDLTLTPDKSDEPPTYGQQVVALNEEIAAAAARHGFALVDLHAASRTRLLARPELISPIDGFHPSDAGYEEWAEIMWPVVKAAVGIP